MNCDNLTIYRPTIKDISEIWQIILQAKAQMKRENRKQWDDDYPAQNDIERDIDSGIAYKLMIDGHIAAYAVITDKGEPAYNSIDGSWSTYEPYIVIHRLAVADKFKRKGIACKFMQLIEEFSINKGIFVIKVDTNYDNTYMQRIFDKLGYSECGIIHYPKGDRIAYEKRLLTKTD